MTPRPIPDGRLTPQLRPHCQVPHQSGAYGSTFLRDAVDPLPTTMAHRYRQVDRAGSAVDGRVRRC
jgi:hypothetical protein